MQTHDIRFDVEEGVATITLHRPEALNTYTPRMGAEIGAAYRHCDTDDEIRAVVLTGAGRAFCAGADLSGGAETFDTPRDRGFSAAAVDPPAFAVRKPVIAAVNGHAIGLGLTLALQCDLRFVAREGRYGVVQVRRGVMPDAYSHWTLPRIAGLGRAAEILLSGRRFEGEELERLGVANRVLPADQVLPAALELARDIARHASPLSVALTKRLLWQSPDLSAAEVEERETAGHQLLMGRPDALEGGLAWVERRAPRWTSRVSRDWPD